MNFELEQMDDDEGEHIESVYLTFQVAGESYAICVVNVTEIVRIQDINKVPGMSQGFRGVINLRGNVIPVLDMQHRFGLAPLEATDRTVIIVLEVDSERAGLMVEEVTEVVELAEDTLGPAPGYSSGSQIAGAMIQRFANRDSGLCMILDVQRLLEECADRGVPNPPQPELPGTGESSYERAAD